MVHAVKVFPEYYGSLAAGDKNFEVRKNDRPYVVGDILAVNEFIPDEQGNDKISEPLSTLRKVSRLFKGYTPRKVEGGCYTGACKLFTITYILDNPQYCKDGMVILGLQEIYKEADGDNESV